MHSYLPSKEETAGPSGLSGLSGLSGVFVSVLLVEFRFDLAVLYDLGAVHNLP